MKHFVKSVAISTVLILLSLIISDVTFPSELSDVEILKKAYKNQRLVSHKGVLNTAVFLGEKPELRKAKRSVVEICQKDGKMRMDYKSGNIAGVSIIDDGKKMMHLEHKNQTVIIRPIPFSHGDTSLLLSNYEVVSKGMEKIAERPTRILQLKPHHAGNPSKKLWIDTETFMPLKREHYNSDGVLTTRSFYTRINYDARIKDSDFSLPKGWQIIESSRDMKKLSQEELSEIVGFEPVEPKYVPVGYVLDGFYLFFFPMRRGKSVHLRYVDGLNCVSVFEVLPPRSRYVMGRMRGFGRGRRMGHGQQCNPRRRMLGNRQGKMIRMIKNNLNIIIVGDIAEAELQKMADSF